MAGETAAVKDIKKTFSKETLIKAGKVVLGVAVSEGINYGADYAAQKITNGKTQRVPHEIGGAVVAIGGAVAKQPAIAVGGLVDLVVNGVRDLTGLDVTNPADAAGKIADRATGAPDAASPGITFAS